MSNTTNKKSFSNFKSQIENNDNEKTMRNNLNSIVNSQTRNINKNLHNMNNLNRSSGFSGLSTLSTGVSKGSLMTSFTKIDLNQLKNKNRDGFSPIKSRDVYDGLECFDGFSSSKNGKENKKVPSASINVGINGIINI